jgi:hypothetical protein
MAIKRLNKRHLEIAQLLLRGMKQCEVARKLRLSVWHVNRVARSPIFREEMSRLHDAADAEVFEQKRQRYLEIAMSNLSILEKPNGTTCQKMKAAGVILGRSS